MPARSATWPWLGCQGTRRPGFRRAAPTHRERAGRHQHQNTQPGLPGRSCGSRAASLGRRAPTGRVPAPQRVGSPMSVVLAVLWAASVGTGAVSQATGGGKQWLHDAVREADEIAVRHALSRGERGLVNTPDQCADECPLSLLDRLLNNCFGRVAQSGLLRYFSLEIGRWPSCWPKLGRTSTSAKTSVRMAVAFYCGDKYR